MAKFGQYEAGHPHVRTGFNAIYIWRPAEKGSPQRVIKAHQPSVRVRDEKLTAAQSQAFLDSAGVQQKAALQDAKHWAPIYESGTAPAGVFYVTDKYDFSARQLVDGRVNLSAAGLHHLVDSIAAGLLTLKRVCGRPHGNLKFSNVLVTKHRDVSKAKVVLCDPLPAGYLEEEIHSKADLQQIGELIHRLVLHRRPPLVAGYQIPDSEEWRRLGKHADDWRGLCNHLLLTDVEAERITLEQLAAKLATMAAHPSNRMLKIGVLVCAAVLLGTLGWPASERIMDVLRPPDPEEASRAYGECCDAQKWLSPLWRKLGETPQMPPGVKEGRYVYWNQQDKSLRELVEQVEIYGEPFAPSDTDLSIPLSPPERLATESRYQKKIISANRARRHIEAILFDGENRAYWPWLKDLRTYAGKLSGAKCQSMADYVNALIGSIGPHEQLAERIDDALYLKKYWPEPDINFDKLAPGGVQEDAELLEKVADVNDFLRKLSALDTHYRLPNEELKAIADRLKALSNRQEELEKELRVRAEDDREAKALLTELGGLGSRPDEINDVPRTEGNRDRIQQMSDGWEMEIGRIREQVKGPDEWYDETWEQAKRGISRSAAINDQYRSYLAVPSRLGRDREAFAVKYKSFISLKPLKDEVEQTQQNLKRLDDRLPRAIRAESIPAEWGEAICQYYETTRREELITVIMGKVGQQEPFPDPNDYGEACRQLLAWPDDAAALMRDFNDIERGLNGCYTLEEELPWASADILSLYARWESHEILKDESLRQVLRDLTARVEELQRIGDLNDVDSLLALAGGETGKIEARYAAWGRLTSLPVVREKWRVEEDIRNRLREQFESRHGAKYLSDERWKVLTETLSRVGQTRARRFWNAVIGSHIEAVRQRAADVPLLERFGELRPEGDAGADELEAFATWAEGLLTELLTVDWSAQYDLAAFTEDDPVGNNPPELSLGDVNSWRTKVEAYRRIEDPRDPNMKSWSDVCDALGISKHLAQFENEAKDEEKKRLLSLFREHLESLEQRFEVVWSKDAIERDRAALGDWERIFAEQTGGLPAELLRRIREKPDLEGAWRQEKDAISLPVLSRMIEHCITPPYCKYIEISSEGNVVLKPGLGFDTFEPVVRNANQPNRFEPLPFRSGLSAFEQDDRLRETFFETMERDPQVNPNVGWPKYIRSTSDPNVVLRFVPQEQPTDPSPFYMAVGEATNAQYLTFLKRRGISADRLVLDTERPALHPYASAILAKGPANVPEPNHPVVWVTFTGAQEYANWLGARVPDTAEHKRAAVFAHDDRRNYTDPNLYHVRTSRWAEAARRYNDDLQKPLTAMESPPVPPAGAVDPRGEYRDAYEPSEFDGLPAPGRFETVWPTATRAAQEVHEIHDLYDLVGSVWEWCLDGTSPRICGGSCLSPLNYAGPDAVTEPTSESACDLGFRVVVRCSKALGQ